MLCLPPLVRNIYWWAGPLRSTLELTYGFLRIEIVVEDVGNHYLLRKISVMLIFSRTFQYKRNLV